MKETKLLAELTKKKTELLVELREVEKTNRKFQVFLVIPVSWTVYQFFFHDLRQLHPWGNAFLCLLALSVLRFVGSRISFLRGQLNALGTEPRTTLPRNAEFLLYLFLGKNEREAIPGDLAEEYTTVVFPKFGPRKAELWYWKHVLSSILPLLCPRLKKAGLWLLGGKAVQELWKRLVG